MSRSRRLASLCLSLAAVSTFGCTPTAAPDEPLSDPPPVPQDGLRAQMRFCAWGGLGLVPDPLPPGYETIFAVAVVEIDSPHPIEGGVLDFALLDDAGQRAELRRVVQAERFEREVTPDEGQFAYYLNPGGTRPWDGATIPSGRTALRIRLSLSRALPDPKRCRLTLGDPADPLIVDRDVDGAWPT